MSTFEAVVIGAVAAFVIFILSAMMANEIGCINGHVVKERQAKGNFSHYVCDERSK